MLYYKAIQVRTPKEALFSNTPSLASIKKQMILFDPKEGELKTKAFITLILTDLVMSFNVGKTMTVPQIGQAVEYIQRDYYFLKPSELKYCFDNAKLGRYGVLYDRIDMAIIFEWIEKYLEERMFIIEDERERNHNEIKTVGSEQNNLVLNAMLDSRFVSPVAKKQEINTNTPQEILKPLNATKLPYHDVHQKWMRQFDKLRMNEKWIVPETNERFIYRYGLEINIEDYFNIKLDQLRMAKERKIKQEKNEQQRTKKHYP